MKLLSRRARRVARARRAAGPNVVAVLLMVAVSTGFVAGCSSAPAPSRAEYRREAGAVCRSMARAIAELPEPNPTRVDQMVRVGRRSVALQRESVRRIRSVEPARADRRRIGLWLDLVERALDASSASLRAQARGDLGAASQANAEGSALAVRADAIARDLGIGPCAAPVATAVPPAQ